MTKAMAVKVRKSDIAWLAAGVVGSLFYVHRLVFCLAHPGFYDVLLAWFSFVCWAMVVNLRLLMICGVAWRDQRALA